MDDLKSAALKTARAYDLAAQKYHELFHNEMNEKEYDRLFLDSFAEKFNRNSLICDAGCGPSGHIGRYLFEKGLQIIGVDISQKCIESARRHNPEMRFEVGDIASLPFQDDFFDGIIAYYSIIHTPKRYMNILFREFYRVLIPNGYLLVAVKSGKTEGLINEILGIKTEIYFTYFTEDEIKGYFLNNHFSVEFMEKRNPYGFEISNQRIFAIGKK